MTVTNTVSALGGKIKSIAPTKAEIELTGAITRETVIHAIEKAGYQVIN